MVLNIFCTANFFVDAAIQLLLCGVISSITVTSRTFIGAKASLTKPCFLKVTAQFLEIMECFSRF